MHGLWNLVELLPAVFIFLNFLANVSCAAFAFPTQNGSVHFVTVKRSCYYIKHLSYKLKWCKDQSDLLWRGKVKQKSRKHTAPVQLKMKSLLRWQSVNCCLRSPELQGKEFSGKNPSLLQGRHTLRDRHPTITNGNCCQAVLQAKLSGYPSTALIHAPRRFYAEKISLRGR